MECAVSHGCGTLNTRDLDAMVGNPHKYGLLALFALVWSTIATAESLQVRVIDSDGQPVSGVAVHVTQDGVATSGAPASAVMDQRNTRFEPHMLVVQRGAAVEFPNSDVIAHHVYSFSKPNDFVLPLYKDTAPEPIVFEHDGIVTLGCNIHDGMLGYIVVVDTPAFGTTDENGTVIIDVDDAATSWTVNAWSPRLRDIRKTLQQTVQSKDELEVTFALTEKLRPAHDDRSEAVSWDDYD